jgi:hypothetical protein
MEGVFGADLGPVRIHSGPTVARAVEAVGARAMTLGTDVYLPGGVADTPRPANLPLVAHELAHAVTHRSGAGAASSVAAPWVRLSRQESNEEQAASGLEASFLGLSSAPAARPGTEPIDLTLGRTPPPPMAGGPGLSAIPSASGWSGSAASIQREEDEDLGRIAAGIYAGGLGATARIQRAEGDGATTTATAPAAAAGAAAKEDKAAEDAAMAERIFKLLQRKMVVERERIGVAGRFGRFG